MTEIKQQIVQLDERITTAENRAWKQRDIEFEGQRVYFDQDYSPDLQGKRKRVREVIKQLKEKNIKAQSPYPAQLKLFLATGVRVFPTLVEAQ
ncbi:hypothetical protein JOQ06_023084 [Pogonophryne albipinna]|uniref:Uncharacterized protein n=1 Tax=Pogonophryne albipinna TaxID=1090488 RepID=A0AAD6A8X6_9TELE|nr:hypothetical protein JOQ06_023084 [Pogonophryne albipinna]